MLKPTQDYIVVKPHPRVQSDILQVISHEPFSLGTIVAVGPGKENKRGVRMPLDAKVGEVVRFGEFKNMYPEYHEDGEKFLIIQEADIAGIVEEQSNASA